MEVWFVIILILSLVYNYFITTAYINLSREYNIIKELHDDLEKIYGSIDRVMAKRNKARTKKW